MMIDETIQRLDEYITHCEQVKIYQEETIKDYGDNPTAEHKREIEFCKDCIKEYQQLAEWLRELKTYREGINNLIENYSIEIVNPFNTYEYMRVVRCADLYDLVEGEKNEE